MKRKRVEHPEPLDQPPTRLVVVENGYLEQQLETLKRLEVSRRQEEERLESLLALTRAAPELDERRVARMGLDEAVRFTASTLGYVHLVNEDQISLELFTWSTGTLQHCTAAHDNHYAMNAAGIWADSARLRHPVVHNDYPHEPGRKGLPPGHVPLLRHASVPILEGERIRLIIGVGNKASAYHDGDLRQLELFGQELWTIIRRKRVEQAWREEQRRLQMALAASQTGMFDFNIETGEVATTPEYARSLGYDPATFSESLTAWQGRMHPEDRPRAMAVLADYLAGRTATFFNEYRTLAGDGGWRWLQVRGAIIERDGLNRPLRMLGTLVNVTALKEAELALLRANEALEARVEERTRSLQDSEARWHQLFDQAPDPLVAFDARGIVRQANAKLEPSFGYTPAQLVGMPLSLLLPELSRQRALDEVLMPADARKMRSPIEMSACRANGLRFPIEVTVSSLEAGDQHLLVASLRDISEQKRAAEALRLSHRRMEALFYALPDLVVRFQRDGTLAEGRIPNLQLLGLSPADVTRPTRRRPAEEGASHALLSSSGPQRGQPSPDYPSNATPSFYNLFPSSLHDSLADAIAAAFATNAVQVMEFPLEVCQEKAHFELRLVMCGADELLAVVRDVTERKRAEEELRESSERLAEANIELAQAARLKDEFLASMSHELRTPLTGILNLSEALQEEVYGPLNPKQLKSLTTIEECGRHLLELINDILDLSKIEAGQFELQMARVALSDICQASVQLVKGMAHKKGVNLSYSMFPATVELRADGRRLKQILVNLLSNAVKFTPEGGRIGLEVIADERTEQVQLTVWDTGVGIAEADFGKLFKPFTQLDSRLSRLHAGTGLGLSLVQRMADMHGGSVSVESVLGKGSRFILKLPWISSEESTVAPAPGRVPTHTWRKAMAIEDSEQDAGHLRQCLRACGVEVLIYPQAQRAVETAARFGPELLFLDLLLEDGSGWDVLCQLRADPATRDIPVIVVSVEVDKTRATELGVLAVVQKPFQLADIQRALQEAAAEEASPLSPPAEPARPSLPTILLADDNETNVANFSDWLSLKGYHVETARNGLEALQVAGRCSPRCILMDIQMPELDGLEAIRRIRAGTDVALAATPIIALTALAMPGDRERCLDAGANEYLSKPVSLKLLLATVQNQLEKRS